MTQGELSFERDTNRGIQFRKAHPRELTDNEKRVIHFLNTRARGRARAVPVGNIALAIDCSYRQTKKIISTLVRDFRANIGSHESVGVFVIQNDLEDWALAERSMAAHIKSRVHRLIMLRDPKRVKELLGQMVDDIVAEEVKDLF